MRVRASMLLAVAGLLGLALPGSAGAATAADPHLGTVSGTATDAATHEPAQDVLVRLYRYDGATGFEPVDNPPVYTGADGSYVFGSLEPGDYTVQLLDATGTYVASTWPAGPGPTGTRPQAPGDPGTVELAAPRTVDAGTAEPGTEQPGAEEMPGPPSAELDATVLRLLHNEGEPPAVTGTLRAGYVSRSQPGGWNADDVGFDYQWQRVRIDAVTDITGATGADYLLTGSDVGREVRVRVTARKDGYLAEAGYSDAWPVDKGVSATTAQLARATIRRTAHARLAVVVRTAPVIRPTGWVTVKVDGRKRASAKLTAASAGRVTVTLPRLTTGRHRVVATYAGSSVVTGSSSRATTLRVTR